MGSPAMKHHRKHRKAVAARLTRVLQKGKLAVDATPLIHLITAPIEPVVIHEYPGMMITGDGDPHTYLEHQLNEDTSLVRKTTLLIPIDQNADLTETMTVSHSYVKLRYTAASAGNAVWHSGR